MAKNTLNITLLGMVVWVALAPAAWATDSMTLAIHDYEPYYNSEGKGMLIDLYQAICDDAGIDVTFKVLPVKRAVEYLFNGKVDAFSPGHIFLSPEQTNQVSLIKTFKVVAVFMYYDPQKMKQVKNDTLESLKGAKVGVIQNSPLLPIYAHAGLGVDQIQTPELLLKMLVAKRFDYIESVLLTGFTMTNRMFKKEAQHFDFMVYGAIDCSVAFLNSNPTGMALIDKFKASFENIKKNGEYIRILECYWGKNNIQKDALPDDLKTAYGVKKASLDVFVSYPRTGWNEIIDPH